MKKATFVLLLMLSGCSTLGGLATNAVTGALVEDKPLLGVDTEIVAGDKQQGVQSGTDTKFDEVELSGNAQLHTSTVGRHTDASGSNQVQVNEGIPYWQVALGGIALLLIGLFTPQYIVRRK